MYSRSSLFVLAIGFSILIVLIAFLGFGAIRRADAIYRDMRAAQDAYVQAETFRRGIATDVYVADILLRDYLLDPSPQSAPHQRPQLHVIRESLQQRLDELSKLVPENDSPELSRLQTEVEAYWDSLDPIFEWTAKEKSERSWIFLARKVLPRREAVVSLAREMARMNAENLDRERQRLQTSQDVLHRFLLQMMTVALILGTSVALLTTYRVLVLERRHDAQRKQIEETQNNLRRLSHRLVQAQVLERTSLFRELHDEVRRHHLAHLVVQLPGKGCPLQFLRLSAPIPARSSAGIGADIPFQGAARRGGPDDDGARNGVKEPGNVARFEPRCVR